MAWVLNPSSCGNPFRTRFSRILVLTYTDLQKADITSLGKVVPKLYASGGPLRLLLPTSTEVSGVTVLTSRLTVITSHQKICLSKR